MLLVGLDYSMFIVQRHSNQLSSSNHAGNYCIQEFIEACELSLMKSCLSVGEVSCPALSWAKVVTFNNFGLGQAFSFGGRHLLYFYLV